MILIHWSNDVHSVGIIKIDEQHKQLIGLINALYSQKGTGPRDNTFVDRIFSTLVNYTRQHFVDEEKMLQKMNYPGFKDHHLQHVSFIRQLNLLKEEFDRKGGSNDMLDKLSRFLGDWIVRHILIEDKAYQTYFES